MTLNLDIWPTGSSQHKLYVKLKGQSHRSKLKEIGENAAKVVGLTSNGGFSSTVADNGLYL